MEWITVAVAIIGCMIGCIFAFLRFWKWWRPLRVSPGWSKSFEERREQIRAVITNVTDKDQVVIRCAAKPIRPWNYILLKHLQRPISSWRFRHNIWFSSQAFWFITDDESLRLSPGERKTLTYNLNLEHPFGQLMAREFIIEVQLSNGRIFRSKRLTAPDNWLLHLLRRRR